MATPLKSPGTTADNTGMNITTCPARLLIPGDRIRLGATVHDVTAVYVLPGRVECGLFDVATWHYHSEVLDPDLDVEIIHTAAQEASPL